MTAKTAASRSGRQPRALRALRGGCFFFKGEGLRGGLWGGVCERHRPIYFLVAQHYASRFTSNGVLFVPSPEGIVEFVGVFGGVGYTGTADECQSLGMVAEVDLDSELRRIESDGFVVEIPLKTWIITAAVVWLAGFGFEVS